MAKWRRMANYPAGVLDGGNLIGSACGLESALYQAQLRDPGFDQMEVRLAHGPVVGAPQGFASAGPVFSLERCGPGPRPTGEKFLQLRLMMAPQGQS